MKLTTLLAAFAGFDLVTASPVSTVTDLAANPASALLQPRARVSWNPLTTYENDPERKRFWEQKTCEVLDSKGCGVGIIQGEQTDDKDPHVKIVGAPHDNMERSKMMRVYHDGSSREGWRSRAKKERPEGNQPPVVHNPLVYWSDFDAYKDEPERKAKWEQACRRVLCKKGCTLGIIQEDEDPKCAKARYVKVLGAHVQGSKKFRVYDDGSSRTGWQSRIPNKSLEQGQQPAEMHKPLVLWDQADAYKDQPERKREWEQKCQDILSKKHCRVGIIDGVEDTLINRKGEEVPYVRLTGAKSITSTKPRKMHVLEDGSYRPRWPPRPAQPEQRQKFVSEAPEVSWDPPDSYTRTPQRRKHWEDQCREALARKRCRHGIIYKGEVAVNKNGQKTSYIHVEGAPSTGMKATEHMRVFYDGSSEDAGGWTVRDRSFIKAARIPRDSTRKRKKTLDLDDPEQTTDNNVTWDPPETYKGKPWLKKAFEDRCRKALAKENCDFGVIHMGHHRQVDPVDGTKSHYMIVSAWKKDNPEKKRLMQLFESGLYEWYPERPLPPKDMRRHKGRARIHVPAAYRYTPKKRGRKEKDTSADWPIQPDRNSSSTAHLQAAPTGQDTHQMQPMDSTEMSASLQMPPQAPLQASQASQAPVPAPTHLLHAGQFQGPNEGQPHHAAIQAQEIDWDSFPELVHLPHPDLFTSPNRGQHRATTFQGHTPFSDLDAGLF